MILLTLLHSEWPKLHRVLAILSAKELKTVHKDCKLNFQDENRVSSVGFHGKKTKKNTVILQSLLLTVAMSIIALPELTEVNANCSFFPLINSPL